jgi:hypothetical protein
VGFDREVVVVVFAFGSRVTKGQADVVTYIVVLEAASPTTQ